MMYKLNLKRDKYCIFLKNQILYLGFFIRKKGREREILVGVHNPVTIKLR